MLDLKTKILTCKGPALFSVGQAGFIIKSRSGALLAIDLYLSNCVERLENSKGFKRLLPQMLAPSDLNFDIIICTHPHLDHFDIDSIPEMMNHGKPQLLCSTDCEQLVHQLKMDYYKDSITYVKPEDNYVIGDFDITFINCDHGKKNPDAVGVLVKVDGHSIYEVGDSCLRLDWVNEIKSIIGDLDILVCPINGEFGNMNSDDAVKFAELIQPSITIPCHYGMFASHGGNLKKFYDMTTENGIPIMIMQQGEEYRL